MKPSHAANLALLLVVVGWLLSVYGGLSQLGDPAPWVPRAEIEAHRRTSVAILFGGIFALLSALWLSGYSFSLARWRASLALLACVVPFIFFFASTLI
jgi:hypothetical protein